MPNSNQSPPAPTALFWLVIHGPLHIFSSSQWIRKFTDMHQRCFLLHCTVNVGHLGDALPRGQADDTLHSRDMGHITLDVRQSKTKSVLNLREGDSTCVEVRIAERAAFFPQIVGYRNQMYSCFFFLGGRLVPRSFKICCTTKRHTNTYKKLSGHINTKTWSCTHAISLYSSTSHILFTRYYAMIIGIYLSLMKTYCN